MYIFMSEHLKHLFKRMIFLYICDVIIYSFISFEKSLQAFRFGFLVKRGFYFIFLYVCDLSNDHF